MSIGQKNDDVALWQRRDQARNGEGVVVKAAFIPKFTREHDTDYDDLDPDYCEEKAAYFWPEGFYESIDNWSDYVMVAFDSENITTHWMPLPEPPKKKK